MTEHSHRTGPFEMTCEDHVDCAAARLFAARLAMAIEGDPALVAWLGVIMMTRQITYTEAVLFALVPFRMIVGGLIIDDVMDGETIDIVVDKLLGEGG